MHTNKLFNKTVTNNIFYGLHKQWIYYLLKRYINLNVITCGSNGKGRMHLSKLLSTYSTLDFDTWLKSNTAYHI